MGALPPGTVRVMPCLGDPYLEIGHFFHKSLGLGEGRGYPQALHLKKHLDGGNQVSFGNTYASPLHVHLLAPRDRDGIKEQSFLSKQVGNGCSNGRIIDEE